MTARRIMILIAAAALVSGAALAGALYLAFQYSPPHTTADQLLSRPEGKLVYPRATVLKLEKHDQTDQGFEPPTEAFIVRTLSTPDPIESVLAWYHGRLISLGYSERAAKPGYASFFRNTSSFDLTYGPGVQAVNRVGPGQTAFQASFSVQPGGG